MHIQGEHARKAAHRKSQTKVMRCHDPFHVIWFSNLFPYYKIVEKYIFINQLLVCIFVVSSSFSSVPVLYFL